MMHRVGISVNAREVSALVLRRGHIEWSDRETLTRDVDAATAVRHVLERLPKGRSLRSRVGLTVGVPWSRVRGLEGLPPHASVDALTAAVREQVSTFFVLGGAPIVSGVVQYEDGTADGAALDRTLVDQVVGAAGAVGVRILVVGPVRHEDRSTDTSHEFADARAAALLTSRSPFACRPGLLPRRRFAPSAVIGTVCAIVAAAGLVAATFTPTLRLLAEDAGMSRRLSALSGIEREANTALTQVRVLTQELSRVEAFRAGRRCMSCLLQHLGESIPDSAAIVSMHIDSLGGTLVVVGPQVLDVLPALSEIPRVRNPRVTGSVTHEVMNDRPLERAAFRFQFPGHPVHRTGR